MQNPLLPFKQKLKTNHPCSPAPPRQLTRQLATRIVANGWRLVDKRRWRRRGEWDRGNEWRTKPNWETRKREGVRSSCESPAIRGPNAVREKWCQLKYYVIYFICSWKWQYAVQWTDNETSSSLLVWWAEWLGCWANWVLARRRDKTTSMNWGHWTRWSQGNAFSSGKDKYKRWFGKICFLYFPCMVWDSLKSRLYRVVHFLFFFHFAMVLALK